MLEFIINWFSSAFATPRNVIAQIIGILPLSLSFFIFTQKTRSKVLVLKSISTFLAVVHFIVLGKTTGALINSVLTVRGIVFSQRGKKGFSGIHIPIIFIAFTILSAIPDFRGIENLLPMTGSCISIIGFWQNDLHRLRWFNLVGVSLWLVYGVCSFSVPSILTNTITIFSIIYALIKEHKDQKTKKN